MFTHILVPLDSSAASERALPHALRLADSSGARVTLLTVVPRLESDPYLEMALGHNDQLDAQWKQRGLDYIQGVRAKQAPHTFPVEAAVALGRPAEAIMNYALDHGVDLIVMSSHGVAGDVRYAFGSTAWKVLQHAACPVLLVRVPGHRS